ncbi:MAG: MFS transporter [Xanthomonadales bacterium]|nr:MFS transporter [Xanthomonadales bacterium]
MKKKPQHADIPENARTTVEHERTTTDADVDFPNQRYAWYVVSMLTVAYTFSFIDRQIINLLVDPIRQDLQLSDTQISLLQGMAFALFYTIMGIPIARFADVANRRMIIGIGVFLWSLMTCACGLAKSFTQLFVARVGVGVGEAALSPSAYSMISDYFPADKVTRAIAVYTGGSFLGAGLAYVIGGFVVNYVTSIGSVQLPLLGTVRTWQMAFVVVGLPGVILAALIFTLREPVRKGVLGIDSGARPKSIPVRTVLAFLRGHWRTYASHMVGVSIFIMLAYAILSWTPAFFVRVHGWTAAEVGVIYGSILLVFGTSGVVGAGWISEALRRRGYKDASLRVIIFGALLSTPFGIAAFLVSNEWLALALVVPLTFFWSLPHGIAPAALQPITPNQMRAQVSAVYMFTINIIGLGLGPTLVAVFTDYVYGEAALVGYSLATVAAITGPLSALIIAVGLKHYRRSLADAESGWKTAALDLRNQS